MTRYHWMENKAGKLLFPVCLFALLLLARDTLITSCTLGFYKSQFLMLGILGVMGLYFLLCNRKNLGKVFTDGRMLWLLVCAAVMLIPMLLKQDWQLMYFSILLCMFTAVFFTYFVPLEETAKYFVLMIAALAVYAVIAAYPMKWLADAGILKAATFKNDSGAKFYDFFLAFARTSKNYFRSYGIFREPGVFQFFLILSLYLNNYVLVWEKKWQLWVLNGILAGTMMTTFSTNGVIEVILLAAVLFLEKKLYKEKRWLIALAVFAGAAAVGLALIIAQQGALYNALYKMVIKLVTINGSSGTRYQAIFVDLMAFLKHPILGAPVEETLHAVKNNTTSTMVLYAILGMAGGTLNVAAWIALVWDKNRKVWVNLALLVILFMSFNTQNITTDVFFWLFPMMALVERTLPLLEEKIKKKKA